MTETVVHVTTLSQWHNVLDVWFKQGYDWSYTNKGNGYREELFYSGSRQLGLNVGDDDEISFWLFTGYTGDNLIEYSEFMNQQKEDNKMETYYVTQEQLDLIQELKSLPAPLVAIMNKRYGIESLYNELPLTDMEWFYYLSGSNQIEFKVKEQLYRLWRIDEGYSKVYMKFLFGTPDWTPLRYDAFTAPLEEIEKWTNPAWEIEEAK